MSRPATGPPSPQAAIRRCPSCGSGDVQSLADRSVRCRKCSFVLFFSVVSAVAALIEDDIGRVLLVERGRDPRKGALDLPGGFVDYGESAEDAIVREVSEELNLEIVRGSLRYLGSFPNTYEYLGVAYRTLDLAFTCTVETFSSQRFSDEIASATFFFPREIPFARIGFSSIQNILHAYVGGRGR